MATTLPDAARNKPQKSHTLQPSLPPSLPPSLLRDRSALVAPSGNGVTWCCKERICESTAARKQQRPSRQSHCRDVWSEQRCVLPLSLPPSPPPSLRVYSCTEASLRVYSSTEAAAPIKTIPLQRCVVRTEVRREGEREGRRG